MNINQNQPMLSPSKRKSSLRNTQVRIMLKRLVNSVYEVASERNDTFPETNESLVSYLAKVNDPFLNRLYFNYHQTLKAAQSEQSPAPMPTQLSDKVTF